LKVELMGSVIMDVMNVEQAKIAEEAGASAVMALGGSTWRFAASG
jgi:pyridoxal biosynthesis lyase PdxS